ncbi:hypothetical protein HD554DRAFT_450487 [Boletus coccyginus]|nr:hypothetical protein HD554DRAFT_450487 [Boletus coccyginus]
MFSPSPTNQVFGIPELFTNIIELVATSSSEHYDSQLPQDDAETRRSLAVLARTCRAFSEPSLDFLWQRLDSLRPLIQCFGGFTVTDFGEECVKNLPSPVEWEVINRYSNRIRELRIPDELSMSFLQFISFQQLSLPNLKLLIWDSHALSARLDIVYIRPLLSPNLLAFDARMEMGKSRALLSFFLNYHILCPNMKSVKLDLSMTHYGVQIDLDLFILAISKAIVNHKKLECLEIFAYVRKGFWEVLFMSLALKVTSLVGRGYTNIFPFTEVSIPPTDTPLQNVRDLRLTIHDLSLFTRLLRPHDQPFCTICLEVQVPLSHTTTEELFAALATHQRQGSLESITIDNSHCDVQEVDHHHPVSFDALRPLVRLGRLRELKIILHNGISLDDAQLGIMAVSWPLLEVLTLDPINPG